MNQRTQGVLEAGLDKEMGFLPEPSEGMQPANALVLAQ